MRAATPAAKRVRTSTCADAPSRATAVGESDATEATTAAAPPEHALATAASARAQRSFFRSVMAPFNRLAVSAANTPSVVNAATRVEEGAAKWERAAAQAAFKHSELPVSRDTAPAATTAAAPSTLWLEM